MGRRRAARIGQLLVVAAAAVAVMAAGLPADPVATASVAEHADDRVPSYEEWLAEIAAQGDPAPDERYQAELDDEWGEERPEPEGMDPIAVRDHTKVKAAPELPEPARSPRAGQPVTWPKPGMAEVKVPSRAQGSGPAGANRGTQASGLPVWVAAPDGAVERGRSAVAPGTAVAVEVLDGARAREHGAALAVRLENLSEANADESVVEITVDYTGFEHAFGGDYGSRLAVVVADSDCVDADPECVSEPVEAVNDPAAGTVTAMVPLSAGGSVMMLTAGSDGPKGDWAATSLSPSGEWAHGGPSGDFAWSYPMRTPGMPGGLGPDLALSYSAQSVDGRTTSTNNQTSWVGEGFDLTPGFVERRYIGCADDMGSGANNTTKTGDLCWKRENAILSLGGSSSELIKDSATGVWRPRGDDGTRVEHLTGAGNGARNGEYWRVTTTDGVQYYFGKHKRSSGDTASTNSVLTVPVAGNHQGEPCYAASFANSFATRRTGGCWTTWWTRMATP